MPQNTVFSLPRALRPLLLGVGLLLASSGTNAQEVAIPCAEHTLWEVNTRGLPACPPAGGTFTLNISRNENCCWSSASLADLNAEVARASRVVIYVHGNWMPLDAARERARTIHRHMSQYANESICFIAYSWPSERQEGFARDLRDKKARIDADSIYLSQFICQLPRHDLGLLGFSFGGPLICGALHLLGGGVVYGQFVDCPQIPLEGMRVSLLAPAFAGSDLTATGRYSKAMPVMEELVNLYNSSDPVLRRFRFFDRDSAIAAGFAGILEPRLSSSPLASDPKITQYDCRAIGRTHAELSYLECSAIYRAYANVLYQ